MLLSSIGTHAGPGLIQGVMLTRHIALVCPSRGQKPWAYQACKRPVFRPSRKVRSTRPKPTLSGALCIILPIHPRSPPPDTPTVLLPGVAQQDSQGPCKHNNRFAAGSVRNNPRSSPLQRLLGGMDDNPLPWVFGTYARPDRSCTNLPAAFRHSSGFVHGLMKPFFMSQCILTLL